MKENFYNLISKIQLVDQVDVLVVGGGTAGSFAAISSGMQGTKTMLIEKNGKLGGTITCVGVNFPGLFYAWGKQVIAGPCWESIKRTLAFDNIKLPVFVRCPEKHWHEQIQINVFTYSTVLDQMCEEANVIIKFHTMISFAEETDDGIYVVCTSKEGLWAVKTKVLIDATGDANIAGILGYERIQSKHLQPATLINDISGYDLKNVDEKVFSDYVSKAFKDGLLEEKDMQGGNIYCQLDNKRISMHITDVDASTSDGKTIAEIAARKTLEKIVKFLKTIPGLENLYVDNFAEECGIRETYRIVGEKIITSDEYLNGYVYDDAICYSFYPIDLHLPTGIKQVFLEEGVVPTIPYNALIPKNSKRLLVAGRCISGDTDSNSAYRVQAPCMAMGQAAGVAASIAAENNICVKEVPVNLLRQRLNAIGAIVPNGH